MLQILELEEPIAQMKIIHVAGTKGKVTLVSQSSQFYVSSVEIDNLYCRRFGTVLTLAWLV